jgi:hypothetical protein
MNDDAGDERHEHSDERQAGNRKRGHRKGSVEEALRSAAAADEGNESRRTDFLRFQPVAKDRTDDADLQADHHKLFQVHGCPPRT